MVTEPSAWLQDPHFPLCLNRDRWYQVEKCYSAVHVIQSCMHTYRHTQKHCIHTHALMHSHTQTCQNTHEDTYRTTHTHTYTHTHIALTHTHTSRTHTHTHTHILTHSHIQALIHADTHSYMYLAIIKIRVFVLWPELGSLCHKNSRERLIGSLLHPPRMAAWLKPLPFLCRRKLPGGGGVSEQLFLIVRLRSLKQGHPLRHSNLVIETSWTFQKAAVDLLEADSRVTISKTYIDFDLVQAMKTIIIAAHSRFCQLRCFLLRSVDLRV